MKEKSVKFNFFCVFLAFFCIFFAIFFIFDFSNANAENKTYVVNSNSAIIYAAPDLSSNRLQTLSHKTEVCLQENNGETEVFTDAEQNYTFFLVLESEDVTSGYILSDLVSLKSETLTQIPNFNAQTNANSTVYTIENSQYVASENILAKGTRIFLYEGYDKSKEFTAISYVSEETVLYGYLLTSSIAPDGVSTTLITCIIVIVALLGIIFAWLFMKNKKKKVNLKKNSHKIAKK